jgi:hypothetical protein
MRLEFSAPLSRKRFAFPFKLPSNGAENSKRIVPPPSPADLAGEGREEAGLGLGRRALPRPLRRAVGLQHAVQVRAARQPRHLGFDRIVASEIEVPNMLASMV